MYKAIAWCLVAAALVVGWIEWKTIHDKAWDQCRQQHEVEYCYTQLGF